jgi:phospho-N-acetylmuramoyl-pentapeptide-transferase
VLTLIIAAIWAYVLSSALTKAIVPALERRRIGQPINDAVPGHAHKAGTPTMGGIAIVGAIVIADMSCSLVLRLEMSVSACSVLALTVAAAMVGLVDDHRKVRSGRNAGLSPRAKFGALAVVGGGFAVATVGLHPSGHAPIVRAGSMVVMGSPIVAMLWILGLVLATSNAVNLTDGMDGLAAGAAAASFGAMAVIAVSIGDFPGYGIGDGTPLAVLAACFAGAALGFLRWNRYPAALFMGDTGSLALGAGLAGLAAVTGTGALLPLVGILFVLEAASVIVLVVVFRAFGLRPFRAPIHHQFERSGLGEGTLVFRLWALAAGGAVGSVLLCRLG